MSGINGFIKRCNNADIVLNNMNKAISHRGKDSQGTSIFTKNGKSFAFGQVRLSIIEPGDKGFQPMFYNKNIGAFSEKSNYKYLKSYQGNSIGIVYDGEIYNHKKLKSILEKKGYIFSSNSDTEVILASYREWGESCVNKFNGMWAFAIFDLNKNIIFCSRDILGKKPLYYYHDGNQFIFSSEIKGILEHKELKINRKDNINPESIDFYLSSDYIPAPWTIYKNVYKLESRYNLTIKINETGEITLKKYCYYNIPKFRPINNKKLLLKTGKELLTSSIKNLIPENGNIGINLSGGLDSSSIVAEVSKYVSNKELLTFSIGFEGEYDESKYINIIKNKFQTQHHHEYFKNDDFRKLIGNIYYYYDEPFADYSIFPTMSLSQLARNFVPFVLTGNLGDEIFGGFSTHRKFAIIDKIIGLPFPIKKISLTIIGTILNFLKKFSKPNAAKELKRKLEMLKTFFEVSLLPKEQIYQNINGTNTYIPIVYKKRTEEKFQEALTAANGNLVQSSIYFDLFYNTSGNNYLLKTDRASMSQSLENRSPFCNKERIERSSKCPTKWKVTYKNTKILFKEMNKGILPQKIINKKKMGFQPPILKWFTTNNYIIQTKEFFQYMVKQGIIGEGWEKFFQKNGFNNSYHKKYNHYILRIFLLKQRYNTWIKE